MANDGNPSTYWQSSSTTGWLAVAFPAMTNVNEVHVHFHSSMSKVPPGLSVYFDTSGNGQYETGERVWYTTTWSNNNYDVIRIVGAAWTKGIKFQIDTAAGNKVYPRIAELEAYLRYDSDGDGLTNDQELSTTYYQDMRPSGLPTTIPDDGVNTTASSVSLTQFYGSPAAALANFSVDHARRTDVTAQVGYWNGSAWIDRYVWDPGKRLDRVSITNPTSNGYVTGNITVVASVLHPEITSKVEFRVGGVLSSTVTTPVGSEYRWTWNTAGIAEGPTRLNTTQYDTVGGKAWSEITVNVDQPPQITWVSPAAGSTVSDTVTVKVTATDSSGISFVNFYVDGLYKAQVLSPNSGTNGYAWSWGTSGYCSNAQHTLKAIAREAGGALLLTYSPSVNVTANTFPLVCITSPTDGSTVRSLRTVTASPTAASGKTISKVDFYLDGSLQFTATASPWSWSWDTTLTEDGWHTLSVTATDSASKTASSTIAVDVANGGGGGGGRCPPICPTGPVGAAASVADGAGGGTQATTSLGVLTSEWTRGETDSGTASTVVVDLVNPQALASAGENASRILRPALPVSLFASYLSWRLVIRDWSQGTAGTVTAFTLRFEVKSDPNDPDTDGDGLADGTEASRLGTLPVAKDSDLDGLDDYYETVPHSLTVSTEGTTTIIAGFVTNPTLSDTDGDGLSDAQERGFVTTGQSKVVGEVGRATGISGTCGSGGVTTVFLRNRYTSAVVIAQPATWNEHDAGVLRVKAVGDHSFDVCFQEWSGSTTHGTESVDYLVVEAGNHILPDGTVVEAGRISAGTAFATSLFREGFAQPPILLAQVQSYADPDIAAARVRAITFTGFDARIRVNAGDTHPSETLGYVAISPQSDPAVLAMWTRGSLTVGATTNPATVAFPKNFSAAPRLLAWYATEGSTADLSLRVEGLTNASATLRREISGTPAAETLHWFAFANSMNLTARMTTRPNGTGSADTDGDTLADGTEVNTYGSNPTLKDTDADGIADNVEVTSRTITIPVNGTSKSFTFKTSPTSDDTDADGIKDPDELAGILDHRALSSDMQTVRTAGILRDLSGNGGDGSILGATCASSVAGRLGYACSFAGSTARIQFADSALVDLTSSFSITAWVYPTTTSQPGGAGIVAKGTGGGGGSYALDVAGGSFRTFFWKSGLSYVAQGTTTFSANTWYLVAGVYDGPAGVLRLYINAGTPVERTGVPSSLAPNNHVLTIGSRESSATSGYNLGFIGRIDEVSIWDRPLSASEIKGYYNLTNSPTAIVAWLDVETRDASNNLFDFSATSHTGVVTGTTVLEGRSGLARSFRGGTDGILLSATTSVSFTGGVSASLYILISSYPTTDASVFGRKGDFYLNLTSDGRVRWSIYTKTTIASPLPIPLNRWVRIVVTAGSAGSSLLLDGVQVASTGTASAPLTASTSVTLGYAEGIASRFIGAMDEILVLNAVPASANTLPNLAIRGILLNPNGTDTDGDRLADGQELFVKSMKTPKRYPIPDYSGVPGIASTASMAAQLSAPAAFLASATAMVGITHTFMGDLIVEVHHVVGGTDLKYVVRSRIGGSTDNNFTSYDMLNAPLSRDRQDFVKSDPWYLLVSDNAWADTGVIEYLQIQLLVHTLPNRADTDGDGLNDSEEINLGSDGFATDPWKADTDADGWSDGYETLTKGTNPVAWDTDGDGVRDSTDLDPLHDLLVAVKVKKVHHGASPWCTPELAGVIRVNDAYTWVTEHRWATEDVYFSIPCLSNIASTAVFDLTYYADVPDDIASASVRGTGWSVDGLLWDDVLVDGSITYTLNSGSPSCTLNSGVSSCTLYNGYSWMTFDVWTVALPKAKTLFVTDGNTTITLANGQSRLVGQDRYYVFTFDVTSAYGPFVVGVNTIVVPRSIFLDSKLKADLVSGNASRQWPLADAPLYGEDLSQASVSESVMNVIALSLSGANAYNVLSRLLQNATNVQVYSYVDVTSYVLLVNLPYDVVRILPWAKVTNGATGAAPDGMPGFVNVLVQLGQMFYDGLVALGTFLVNLAEAIADWGMKQLGQLWNTIASTVQKAMDWLSQETIAAARYVASLLNQGLSYLRERIVDYVDGVVSSFLDMLRELSKWNTLDGDESAAATDTAVIRFALSFIGLQSKAEELVFALKTLVQALGQWLALLRPSALAQLVATAMGYDVSSAGNLWDGPLNSMGQTIGTVGGVALNFLLGHSLFSGIFPQNAAAGFSIPSWLAFSTYLRRSTGLDVLGPIKPAAIGLVDGLGSTLNVSPLSILGIILFILSFAINVAALRSGEEFHPLGLILSISMFIITLPAKFIYWSYPEGNVHAVVGMLLSVVSLGMSLPAVVSGVALGGEDGGPVGAAVLGAILVANVIVAAVGLFQSLDELKRHPLPP